MRGRLRVCAVPTQRPLRTTAWSQGLLLRSAAARYPGPSSAADLAQLVKFAPSRLARLIYIAEANTLASTPSKQLIGLYTALSMPDAAFSARFPDFAAWLAANAAVLDAQHPPLLFTPGAARALAADTGRFRRRRSGSTSSAP